MSLHLTIKSSIPKDSSNTTFYDNLDIEFSGSSTLEEKFWIGKEVENNKDNWPYIDDENTTLGKYDPHYYINLVELNFDKQMYRPGEITARIQIRRKEFSKKETKAEASRTMFHLLSLAELTGYFMNCEVELKNKDETKINTIAEKYIVKELTPEYTSEQKSIYINLKMYSPDIALTGKIANEVNVAKQLGEEILKAKCTDAGITLSIAPQNKLAYRTYEEKKRTYIPEKGGAQITETVQILSSTDEYIHPYLVQYNESFYDMLIRTANRWGEFVYFEGGNLVLGLNSSVADDIETYQSVSYINNNPHDSVADINAKAAVVSDEYLEVIKKSHKPARDGVRRMSKTTYEEKNQYILQAGDMYATDDVYSHRLFQSMLNMKGNLFDWGVSSNLDEGILAAQNEYILYRMEQEYNHNFFDTPLSEKDSTKLARIKKHYSDETNPEKCCQFAYYTGGTENGGLTKTAYKDVLDNEIAAGQNMLSIDLGTTYTHLCLGKEFKFSGDTDNTYYLVTGVTCRTEKNKQGKNELHFYVTAIKNTKEETKYDVNDASKDEKYRVYYPSMLPTGHVRFSGPQRGKVQDTMDPMLNGRYRVFLAWQNGTGDSSPWLRVSREMTKKGCGGVWQLDKDTEVLLDFQDGNVELPYIVGTLQETGKRSSARSNMFNNLDLTTPAGHAIRLSDGYGAGSANFIASFIPLVGMIKGFTPDLAKSNFKEGNDRYYDGGMELTDRYGIYSIKASTDKRNITINSPFGDVSLNAFTGITICSPNGDVKIKGKNVSIEAGNKLTLESGKNIHNAILGSTGQIGNGATMAWTGEGFASTLGNAALNKAVSYIDFTPIRCFWDAILRPIDGTLEIKSNRYLFLEAGKGEATIQTNRYEKDHLISPTTVADDTKKKWECYVGLAGAISVINRHVDDVFNTIESLERIMNDAKNAYESARSQVAEIDSSGHDNYTANYKPSTDGECKRIKTDQHGKVSADNGYAAYTKDDLFHSAGQAYGAADTGDTPAMLMLQAANNYATAAYNYYKYIKDHTDSSKTTQLGKNTIGGPIVGHPKTKYYTELTAAAGSVGTIGVAIFDPAVAPVNMLQKRKETKQKWFAELYNSVLASDPNIPIARTLRAAAYSDADHWNDYVNGFADDDGSDTKWYKKILPAIGNSLLNIVKPFADPVADRMRWEPGCDGQIILSDQPANSIMFEPDGTPKMYLNSNATKNQMSASALKKLLREW